MMYPEAAIAFWSCFAALMFIILVFGGSGKAE